MYGQFHIIAQSMVEEYFGIESWQKIMKISGLDPHADFMIFHQYEDCMTLNLFQIMAEVLNITLDRVMELFGEHFIVYSYNNGYEKMLRSLGHDMATVIQSLDSFHVLLAMSYKRTLPPSFRGVTNNDGTITLQLLFQQGWALSDGSRHSENITVLCTYGCVHYYSGLVRSLGRVLFDISVESVLVNIGKEVFENGREQEHTEFLLTIDEKKKKDESRKWSKEGSLSNDKNAFVKCPHKELNEKDNRDEKNNLDIYSGNIKPNEKLHISYQSFCDLFPYHFVFDRGLCIRQMGTKFKEVCTESILNQTKLSSVVSISQPKMPLTFENLQHFINSVFVLKVNRSKRDRFEDLTLKGQMVWMEDNEHMIFLCSPHVGGITELVNKKMFLSDIPLYDVTREFLLLNEQRANEMEISKRLDQTTSDLKRTATELEREKEKTDMLLYQMLPRKVAEQLRNGYAVEAEKYEDSTVVFSDIVTFTSIAAAVQPIDIVNLLNALYSKFDDLTNIHKVYKVETIGDAYMVVGGVPEKSNTHALNAANMAIDMVKRANEVKSPATNMPIQIRVGMHSGPVVAGVVGAKMPRYCLFGDTVNTASRMESNGAPGRIHISSAAHKRLENSDYLFEERGEINVKGKGMVRTYFLIGRSNDEPEDRLPGAGIQNGVKNSPEQTQTNKDGGSSLTQSQQRSSLCIVL